MNVKYDGFYEVLKLRGLKPYDLEKGKIISRGTINKIRNGENVNIVTIGKICEFLDCEIEDIVKADNMKRSTNATLVDYQPMYDLMISKGYDTRFLLGIIDYEVLGRINTHQAINIVYLNKIADALGCEINNLTKPYVPPKKQTPTKTISKRKVKAIYQIDISNDSVKLHTSIYDAAKSTGINRASISRCASGKLKTAGGYVWVMVDNFSLVSPGYRIN